MKHFTFTGIEYKYVYFYFYLNDCQIGKGSRLSKETFHICPVLFWVASGEHPCDHSKVLTFVCNCLAIVFTDTSKVLVAKLCILYDLVKSLSLNAKFKVLDF